MYAHDFLIVAEHREELQGALEEWNDMFKKHGLKMNLDKTEVMWVGKQRQTDRQTDIHIYSTKCTSKQIVQVNNCAR